MLQGLAVKSFIDLAVHGLIRHVKFGVWAASVLLFSLLVEARSSFLDVREEGDADAVEDTILIAATDSSEQ